jgi:hypothetical protein
MEIADRVWPVTLFDSRRGIFAFVWRSKINGVVGVRSRSSERGVSTASICSTLWQGCTR